MKIISFSATEILPALLNKTKTQTIRPLWRKAPIPPKQLKKQDEMLYNMMQYVEANLDKISQILPTGPRFKVGDKVKLMWKQRSKYPLFCRKCGNQIHTRIHNCLFPLNETKLAFPKLLGTGTITEVFEIEMGRNYIIMNGVWLSIYDCEQIAKLDGFKTVDDFFHYFNKHYDLSTPKRFAVYRWGWDVIK